MNKSIKTENVNLSDFEIRILAENNCKSILPANIVKKGANAEIEFDTDGCMPLSEAVCDVKTMLTVIERTALEYMNMEQFPLFCEKMRIAADTVFITGHTDVRFVYCTEDSRPLNEKLAGLCREMISKCTSDPWLLERMYEFIVSFNPNLRRIANKACTLKREIVRSAWDRE